MTVLTYKGFAATVDFDPEDMILVGKLVGINDSISFHGETGSETIAAFHEAVDDYIETCTKVGKKPEKPYSGKVMFRVDPVVHAQAALAAQIAGKSLNAWGEDALRTAAERTVGEGVRV